MPRIESIIRCELNPAQPVQELCTIIAAVSTHQVNAGQEQTILLGLQKAIEQLLAQITKKGSERNAEIPASDSIGEDK